MEHSVYYDRKHRFINGLRFGGWIIFLFSAMQHLNNKPGGLKVR